MNQDILIDAIGNIDEEMIEKHIKMRADLDAGVRRKQRSHAWIKWTALTACLALIISAVPLWALMRSRTEPIPTYDDAYFSAEDIVGLFGIQGTATNDYKKVWIPDPALLYLAEIPADDYLPIYEETYIPLDEDIFRNFADRQLTAIAGALGCEVPEYEIRTEAHVEDQLPWMFHAYADVNDCRIGFSQYCHSNTNSVSIRTVADRLILNGKTVMINPTQSDEEIILSLSEIREELAGIFGKDFPDARVIRDFYKDSYRGVNIYFYDESAHPLNRFYWANDVTPSPFSGGISLYFFDPEYKSLYDQTELYNVWVHYDESRMDISEFCKPVANAKRLSLEKAEEMLEKGYVFGGHSCWLCGRQEEAVDFTDYDLAGLTYLVGQLDPWAAPGPETRIHGIPFYVFYKQIGIESDGNLIYAKTYVPAIEVSGLDEYFQKQAEFHQNYISRQDNYTTVPKDEDE